MKSLLLRTVVTACLLLSVLPVKADDAEKPYPLNTCLMCGMSLPKNPVTFVYQGQQIKVCSMECEKLFLSNPKKYLAEMNKQAKAQGQCQGQCHCKSMN